MAKNKKKRNKSYTGIDAAITKPIVTRISAINRSKPSQWWFENKKTVKPILITISIVFFVVIMILEIVRIAGGGF